MKKKIKEKNKIILTKKIKVHFAETDNFYKFLWDLRYITWKYNNIITSDYYAANIHTIAGIQKKAIERQEMNLNV